VVFRVSAGGSASGEAGLSTRFDLVIVGGGVIGCAIAYRARRLFNRIAIVDAGRSLGSGASSAAIGGIAPHSDDVCGPELGVLAELSRELYPAWLQEIAADTGYTVPLHTGGLVRVALSADEMDRLENDTVPRWRARGFAFAACSQSRLRVLAPGLSPRALGGYLLPREACLDPALLLSALISGLEDSERLTIRCGTTVDLVRAGRDGVVVGLRGGERLVGDRVVLAAGLGSGRLLPGHSVDPMRPVKGQAIEFEVPGAADYPLDVQLYAAVGGGIGDAFLLPRSDGRVVAGVTYEYGDEYNVPTREGYESVLAGANELFPETRGWTIRRQWCGIRPATVDGLPIIGPLEADPRVVVATGHFGLGVTLAPVTAELVCSMLDGTGLTSEQQDLLELCRPERFVGLDTRNWPNISEPAQ
jgi:glycine oxidase